MNKIPLKNSLNNKLKSNITIMIFAEGTILKPKSWFSLYNHNAYVPIGNAAALISLWYNQGANIIYCTSRRNKQAENIACLLDTYGFCGDCLISREHKESYKDIVETIKPNILIEDDCKSIGGAWQMCITHVAPAIKNNIVSVIVSEFKGIDNLPEDINKLSVIM